MTKKFQYVGNITNILTIIILITPPYHHIILTQSYFKYKVNSTEFERRHLGPKYKFE